VYENTHYGRINFIDSQTCDHAAAGGSVDCLQLAHEYGALWSRKTCEVAAENGHLGCLRYEERERVEKLSEM
jgi:hypothetical protein